MEKSIPPPEALSSEPPAQAASLQSFGKAIAVLNLVAEAPMPPRFTDLLVASGLPKGTLHRLLAALDAQRLVRQAPDQTWRLGPRLLELAHRAWSGFDLREAARHEMQALARTCGGSVHLGVLESDEALVIESAEPATSFRLSFGIGRRLPLGASALGRALLAFQPPMRRDGLVARLAGGPPMDRLLDLAIARGYALDEEEWQEGVCCAAAPILDPGGAPLGALSVSLPRFRTDAEALHGVAHHVMEAARRIAGNTGAVPAFSLAPRSRPPEPPPSALRCIAEPRTLAGDAPLWHDGALHLVDLLDPALLRIGGDGEVVRIGLPDIAACLVPRATGGLVAGTRDGIFALDPATGAMTPLAALPIGPRVRINDGACDPGGRLWVGTTALDGGPGQGGLWRIDDEGATEVEAGFGVANGVAFAADGTALFFADSRARTIWRFACDPATGAIGGRAIFARFTAADGNPGGLAVDRDGGLWTALWDGWSIVRLHTDGSIDRRITLPVPRPGSLAFGGADSRTLFITTARIRLSAAILAEAPLSGAVLSLTPGVTGLPPATCTL